MESRMTRPGNGKGSTHCSRALVFRVGSSGRKFLYSSTSFSRDSSWLCSLLRRVGSDSRMWLVSCCKKGKGQTGYHRSRGQERTQSTLSPEYSKSWVQSKESHRPTGKSLGQGQKLGQAEQRACSRCRLISKAGDSGTSVQAWDGPDSSKTQWCPLNQCIHLEWPSN